MRMSPRAQFISTMLDEGMPMGIARLILRDASTVQRLDITGCNRELTKREEKRMREACARIERRAADFGMKVRWGDPRGYSVGLILKSGKYNSMGGSEAGYGVPTRRY